MTKAKLIDRVAGDTGLTKKEADQALTAIVQGIASIAKEEGKITIPGFGTFKHKLRAARSGRNPQTGETLQIAEKWELKFQPAKNT